MNRAEQKPTPLRHRRNAILQLACLLCLGIVLRGGIVHANIDGGETTAGGHVTESSNGAGTEKQYNYILMDLEAMQYSQYTMTAPERLRHYLKFANQDGSHYIIYEESKTHAPLREVQGLKQSMEAVKSKFVIELNCNTKAFCTGDCKNKYYEVTNAPDAEFFKKSDKCSLNYFSYEKEEKKAESNKIPNQDFE